MKYITLGRREIPALGFGTWQLTGKTCVDAVEHALDLGYRHIDTAQAYDNEREVGAGLKASGVAREDIFLTTKIWNDNHAYDDAIASVEASLRKLGTSYVDMLLIHWPCEDEMPFRTCLDAMMWLQDQGKTRHIGVSNFTPAQLTKALQHAPIQNIQVEYHPLLAQTRMLEIARQHKLMLTAYSPLARGDERVLDSGVVTDIAEAHGKTPGQVVLRWLMEQDQVAAIPKASSPEHREANLDIFDFTLSDAEMRRMNGMNEDERLIDPDFAPDWAPRESQPTA